MEEKLVSKIEEYDWLMLQKCKKVAEREGYTESKAEQCEFGMLNCRGCPFSGDNFTPRKNIEEFNLGQHVRKT